MLKIRLLELELNSDTQMETPKSVVTGSNAMAA